MVVDTLEAFPESAGTVQVSWLPLLLSQAAAEKSCKLERFKIGHIGIVRRIKQSSYLPYIDYSAAPPASRR